MCLGKCICKKVVIKKQSLSSHKSKSQPPTEYQNPFKGAASFSSNDSIFILLPKDRENAKNFMEVFKNI